MDALTAQLEHRAKAVAAFIFAGVATYAATAVAAGTPLTARGLEVAAFSAALTALGVHTAPRNKEKPPKRVKKA